MTPSLLPLSQELVTEP